MASTSKLEVTLLLDGGKAKSLTIDSPKAGIGKQEVQNFVNSFAGTEKMMFSAGNNDDGTPIYAKATALKKARVKTVNYTVLN